MKGNPGSLNTTVAIFPGLDASNMLERQVTVGGFLGVGLIVWLTVWDPRIRSKPPGTTSGLFTRFGGLLTEDHRWMWRCFTLFFLDPDLDHHQRLCVAWGLARRSTLYMKQNDGDDASLQLISSTTTRQSHSSSYATG